jgi:HD-GYP domain-containing protein (c-di-GMP phosphodiesterase class II)
MTNRNQRELNQSKVNINTVLVKILVGIFSIACIVYFSLYFESGTETQSNTEETNASSKVEEIQKTKIEPIKQRVRLPQIEILNGCGISNITSLFRDFFIDNKVDIISTGNYKDFKQKNSFLIVHSEVQNEKAKELAEKLGIKEQHIIYEIEGNPLQEFTLVLGSDFTKLHYK